MVALLAEGVDRNMRAAIMSLYLPVALLAEGVDRNFQFGGQSGKLRRVALLAEGVDRNWAELQGVDTKEGRPPRGGRG